LPSPFPLSLKHDGLHVLQGGCPHNKSFFASGDRVKKFPSPSSPFSRPNKNLGSSDQTSIGRCFPEFPVAFRFDFSNLSLFLDFSLSERFSPLLARGQTTVDPLHHFSPFLPLVTSYFCQFRHPSIKGNSGTDVHGPSPFHSPHRRARLLLLLSLSRLKRYFFLADCMSNQHPSATFFFAQPVATGSHETLFFL